MSEYWYSTNGLIQRRLSSRHLHALDQAFESHARIQLLDEDLFGPNVVAIANPYQGTMTASDIHYGLYRQPPMWRMSNSTLDGFILMDIKDRLDDGEYNNSSTKYTKFIQKKVLEETCICCVIS
jgi:hypothetical protein